MFNVPVTYVWADRSVSDQDKARVQAMEEFAAAGARLGIYLINSRIRSNAGDLTGFCYYNWGQALLCLALFLLV